MERSTDKEIKYSIVIPIYNQWDYVCRHLEEFTKIWEHRQDFEVIFVDDGSTGAIPRELPSLFTSYPLYYLQQEDHGFRVALAKNRGIRKAHGDWTLILDGDVFITEETLSAYDLYIKMYDNVDALVAFFGPRNIFKWDKLADKLRTPFQATVETGDFRGRLKSIPPENPTFFSGTNVLFPTYALKIIEWAPDDWVGYGFDDYYCSINWLSYGGVFVPADEAISYHVKHDVKGGDPILQHRLEQHFQANKPVLDKVYEEFKSKGPTAPYLQELTQKLYARSKRR